jgi:ribosomal protein S18 acetylase RimI-like enzyme
LAVRALPAERVDHLDGWLLRADRILPFSRANAVWSFDGPKWLDDEALDARVREVERFFADAGTRPQFMLSPASRPTTLDATLARHGYDHSPDVDVLIGSLTDIAGPLEPLRRDFRAKTVAGASPDHTASYVGAYGSDPIVAERLLAYVRVLPQNGLPLLTSTAVAGHDVVGICFGVVDDAWLGVYSMGTVPTWRGRGVGPAVLAALARGGSQAGATRAYLQVEVENLPAQRLYRSAGFEPSHRYHYRVAPG